jgi:hypothetical protein
MRNNLLALLALVAACGTKPVAAAPDAPSNSAGSTASKSVGSCTGGDVYYQVDRVDVRRSAGDQVISSIVVRTSGAWTYDVLDGKRLVRKGSGCMAAPKLADLRKHIDGAPWKLTPRDAMCEIFIPVRTEYRVGTRLMWTAASCTTPDILDDKSQAAIAAAGAILGPIVGI